MSMFRRTITVSVGTQLVEYRHGIFRRVLDPGKHKRPRKATYRAVLVREQIAMIALQEVPTSDGLSVRVSAAVRWAVGDARKYVEVAQEPFDIVYLAVQVALRESLVDVVAEDAAAHVRRAVSERLTDAAQVAGAEFGINVHAVLVKDVVTPHELRIAQAELVTARARAQVQLEQARADTAALRSLANAAKLLDEHPALAQQRLVQSLPHGSSIKLSVSSGD